MFYTLLLEHDTSRYTFFKAKICWFDDKIAYDTSQNSEGNNNNWSFVMINHLLLYLIENSAMFLLQRNFTASFPFKN